MDAHPAEEQREAAELVEHEAEIRARLFYHLLRVDKQRGHEEHQQKQQHQPRPASPPSAAGTATGRQGLKTIDRILNPRGPQKACGKQHIEQI